MRAGLLLAAANAVIAGAQEAFAPGPDAAGRAIASAVLAAIPIAALVRWRSAVALLERDDRWLLAWSLVAVAAFAIDGPGDQLLLPAALGPVAMAGLVGHPRRALACAAIVDTGYLALTAAYGSLSWRGDGLHLATENAIFVFLAVAITALPVKIAMRTSDAVPHLLLQMRLNGSGGPAPLPRRPDRSRLPPGTSIPALPVRASTIREPLLTKQETRILLMLRDGQPYKLIALSEAMILGRACSKHRVYRIVAEIKRKVGARSRNQLARMHESEFGL